MSGVMMVAAEAFGGVRVLENTTRLVTMLIGFPLALVALKFGITALRKHEPARGWGAVSYGLIALVPAIGRAMNFGNPVNWVTTGVYIAGLVAGAAALVHRATLSAWWHGRPRRTQNRGDDDYRR